MKAPPHLPVGPPARVTDRRRISLTLAGDEHAQLRALVVVLGRRAGRRFTLADLLARAVGSVQEATLADPELAAEVAAVLEGWEAPAPAPEVRWARGHLGVVE